MRIGQHPSLTTITTLNASDDSSRMLDSDITGHYRHSAIRINKNQEMSREQYEDLYEVHTYIVNIYGQGI